MHKFLLLLITICGFVTIAAAQQTALKSQAEVGNAAPEFEAKALSGKTYKLADLRGKVVVLNFWQTRCINCVAETATLNKLVEYYKNNDNVVFLAFAHDDETRVKTFLKKNPFKYEILPASLQPLIVPYGKPMSNGFYDLPFPMHVVIDQKGIVQVNETGEAGVAVVQKKLAEIVPSQK